MPSSSTSVRLTPLGPMPRSDTPCAVGCDDRLLVRRNRLNVGTCRSTSSATTAGDCRMSSRVSTLTLAGRSPVSCWLRAAVTVTVSETLAGARTTSIEVPASAIVCRDSANPPARTISRAPEASGTWIANRPSAPVRAWRSGPAAGRRLDGRSRYQLTRCVTHDARDDRGRGRRRLWHRLRLLGNLRRRAGEREMKCEPDRRRHHHDDPATGRTAQPSRTCPPRQRYPRGCRRR